MPAPRTLALVALAATLPLGACTNASQSPRYGYNDSYRGDRYERRYDNGYRLSRNDRIYRDENGNYYCRKPDGTTGAIVGGVAGGVLGNVIAPRGSKTLGTIIGAAGGALIGQAVEKGEVKCQ